jgi:non-specific serine/threonine protein kinase
MLSEDEKRAIEKAPRVNVQAYEYYLRGRQLFHQWRRKSVEHARRMFERAIEIDPNYALAYAGIADCCSYTFTYWDASAENLAQADTASHKALELDSELAEAHTSRGLALTFAKRYSEAETEFETAIRLNAKSFDAHYLYARARFQQGKLALAAESFAEATRLRPDDYQAASFLAQAYDGLGRKTDALATHQRTLQAVEKHVELNPDDPRALCLGAIELVYAGHRERALEWARRALAIDPEDSLMLYNTACFYAIQGEPDEAFACLDKALQLGWGHREWLENDSDLDALRGDPRFQALLKKL